MIFLYEKLEKKYCDYLFTSLTFLIIFEFLLFLFQFINLLFTYYLIYKNHN